MLQSSQSPEFIQSVSPSTCIKPNTVISLTVVLYRHCQNETAHAQRQEHTLQQASHDTIVPGSDTDEVNETQSTRAKCIFFQCKKYFYICIHLHNFVLQEGKNGISIDQPALFSYCIRLCSLLHALNFTLSRMTTLRLMVRVFRFSLLSKSQATQY